MVSIGGSKGCFTGRECMPRYSVPQMLERIQGWYRLSSEMLLQAARQFGIDRASRMSAAIAYRVVFALAPLLIIAVSVLGAVVGSSQEAESQIVEAIEGVVGPEVAELMADFLRSALAGGRTAAIIGTGLLLWTSSSLFLEMQHDLNDIFKVRYDKVSGIVALAIKRGIGVLWALGLGLAVLAVWLLNAVWRFLGGLFPEGFAEVHEVIGLLTPLISVALLPLLFGLIFQTMTALKVRWRTVWWGSLFTSVVFVLAAYGIGAYFATFETPTAIGFASSFVVILFLAYVLSSVFLFGVEVTKAYSDHLDREEGGEPMGVAPQVLVSEPPTLVPKASVLAFLAGLFVGWRRSRR